MNEIADGLLQLSYSPAINVYVVWILGAYGIYKTTGLYYKTFDDLSDSEKKMWKSYIKNEEIQKWKVGIGQLLILPFLGIANDFIFMMIGGPVIVVYSKLWWGQFLPFSTITEIFF
tara:strand:+ start:344 stop:691 length:348 start_codon:yes stop_codon:yes gene_type:complete